MYHHIYIYIDNVFNISYIYNLYNFTVIMYQIRLIKIYLQKNGSSMI